MRVFMFTLDCVHLCSVYVILPLSLQGIIALCEMVEFYGCATRLLLAHNNKLRPRAWLTIGRTLKKVSALTSKVSVLQC